MVLFDKSDYFSIAIPTILFSVLFSVIGSMLMDYLYARAPRDLLSFPEQVTTRAKYRRPLLFLLLTVYVGRACITVTPPALFYLVIAIVCLSIITATDFEQYVIFDVMLVPFAATGILYTIHMGLPITGHIAASLGGGLVFLLLAIVTKGAIGGGDIKLIAAMGLWLGIRPLLSVIVYGFIAGGVAAFILLLTKQKSRHSYFAYGPYFALSGLGILLKWFRALF